MGARDGGVAAGGLAKVAEVYAARARAALAALDEVDDQRHAVHPVAGPQPVLDEVRVVAGHARARVDLDRKARRALADLGHVDQFQAMPAGAAARADRRLASLDGLGQEAVQLGRGDAPGHAVAERDRLAQQARDVAAGLRADGQHARAQAQLFGHACALVLEIDADALGVLAALLHVPLVQHDRGRAAGLHRQLGDAQILRGDAVGGVTDDERDIRALGGALGAQRRVVLDRVRDLRLAAHAGGVDEDQLALADHQRHVDRVAGGARDVGDDHPLLAEEAVDERGLADVRPADDAPGARCRRRARVIARRQQLDDAVEQVARAEALRRGDRHRLAQAEPMELARQRQLSDAVALVRGDDRRQRRAAQQVGHLLIARAHARARVDDQHRDLRVGHARPRLVADRAGERILVLEVDAAGVDQREAAPVPLAVELLAVARHARALVHDRLAGAREAVDQRGLADVRIADDGDLHQASMTAAGPDPGSVDAIGERRLPVAVLTSAAISRRPARR